MNKLLILSMFSISLFSCEKHVQGCAGPLAINYNLEAKCDDGSCIYSESQKIIFLNWCFKTI